MEKIKLVIAGETYTLSTDEDLDYMVSLGSEIDKKITELISGNSKLSVTQASVLTLLEYADMCKKSESDCENLRSQIQIYLNEAARAKTDAEIAKREADKLSKELEGLKR